MASRFCEFPEGVLIEVLSWLPPESLMRFKCVSKYWYALINSLVKDPEFVYKHLHNIDKRTLSSTTCLVFCCPQFDYFPDLDLEFLSPFDLFSSVTISNDDYKNDCLEHVSEDFDLPIISSEEDMTGVLGYHCNGIICLTDFVRTFMLCNPAIKEYRALPQPCHAENDFVMLGAGFGYDSRANDYKVVKFGLNKLRPDMLEHLKAEVYSLRSDSWREIGIRMQFDGFPFFHKEVFCKGVFYWSMRANDKQMIVSFDMFDEVFRRISLPDNLQTEEQIRLMVWNESVTLLLYPGEIGATVSFEVWVMNSCFDGVKGSSSWIKKLTIGPLVGIQTPWTFWKNDELLMEATDESLLSYNLRSQKLRNLTIQGVKRIWRWDFSYVKSLVSVQVGNQACR